MTPTQAIAALRAFRDAMGERASMYGNAEGVEVALSVLASLVPAAVDPTVRNLLVAVDAWIDGDGLAADVRGTWQTWKNRGQPGLVPAEEAGMAEGVRTGGRLLPTLGDQIRTASREMAEGPAHERTIAARNRAIDASLADPPEVFAHPFPAEVQPTVGHRDVKPENVPVVMRDEDLGISYYHPPGSTRGVHDVEVGVRILHKPSGLVFLCHDDRSRIKNKTTALQSLRAQLASTPIPVSSPPQPPTRTAGGYVDAKSWHTGHSQGLREGREEGARIERDLHAVLTAKDDDVMRERDHREEQIERIHAAFGKCEQEWTSLHDLGTCAEEMADTAADELAALRAQVEEGAAARAEDQAAFLACAQAIGIVHEADGHPITAGPVERVVEAIREAVENEDHYRTQVELLAEERDALRVRRDAWTTRAIENEREIERLRSRPAPSLHPLLVALIDAVADGGFAPHHQHGRDTVTMFYAPWERFLRAWDGWLDAGRPHLSAEGGTDSTPVVTEGDGDDGEFLRHERDVRAGALREAAGRLRTYRDVRRQSEDAELPYSSGGIGALGQAIAIIDQMAATPLSAEGGTKIPAPSSTALSEEGPGLVGALKEVHGIFVLLSAGEDEASKGRIHAALRRMDDHIFSAEHADPPARKSTPIPASPEVTGEQWEALCFAVERTIDCGRWLVEGARNEAYEALARARRGT